VTTRPGAMSNFRRCNKGNLLSLAETAPWKSMKYVQACSACLKKFLAAKSGCG
jgi:hypothetical protein